MIGEGVWVGVGGCELCCDSGSALLKWNVSG